MKCPVCGCERTIVYDVRKSETKKTRRRECSECLTRWVTEEKFVRVIPPDCRGSRSRSK